MVQRAHERTGPEPARVDVFALDDEIGPALARIDWSAHPLGEPEAWPQSLLTALGTMLASRFSMWMAWGSELTFFCNAAYRRDTLGRKYPWALGRPAREVWAEIWPEIAPRIETVLRTGKATWDEALLLFLERSGYTEETYHTFSYSPLRDEAGAVSGMLCVVTEDTERVVAERRMETLRDLGSDRTTVRDERGVLSFCARQLGRDGKGFPFSLIYLFEEDGSARLAASSGIAAGHPAAAPVLPADGSAAAWPMAAAAGGETVSVQLDELFDVPLPSGDWPLPPIRALVAPLPQPGHAPFGFVVAGLNRYRPLDEGYRGFVALAVAQIAAALAGARAYRAQERRVEDLAELDRVKTAFFSNVSHEFRTPLTLINGPVEELRARLGESDPQTREALEVIGRNGLRLGRLVNALLDFSRIEAGRMRARFVPTDLGAATAELAGSFRSAVERAGLGFEVGCPALPEPVYLDRELWEKVVLNLVSNALKFTFEGSIGVAVRADGDHAVVTVTDTGTGVPAAELPRLFERFHRVENVMARSHEGSGIGLALVRELVTLHGGTIEVESVEGDGTTFTIRLPFGSAHLPPDAVAEIGEIAEAAGTGPSASEAFVQEAQRWLAGPQPEPFDESETAAQPAPAARILVVDDNADMREYLSRLLRAVGYRVSAVADGAAALEDVQHAVADLVISDVMMPGISGLNLVAALRAEPRTAGIPVFLLSARAGQEASIEGLEAGADDYLVKPFSAAELLARVRANIELSRLRTRQARWRNALIDSLQEAFFACDETGAIVEINAAFTAILGYGPDGLPYSPPHPWWPDAEEDPEGHRLAAAAHHAIVTEPSGVLTIPLIHPDGRRVWITVSFNEVRDPDSGRRMNVGTFRDTTAEHYAVQRDAAVAAVSLRLSAAADLDQAFRGVLEELRTLWRAERVLAAVFPADGSTPVTAGFGAASWAELDEADRAALLRQSEMKPLAVEAEDIGRPGVVLQHPRGTLAIRLVLGRRRTFSADDQMLLSLLAGHLAHGLARANEIERQRETAMALQHAILGPAKLPEGFAVRYEPAARPLEVGGDWYDTVVLADGRVGIVVGDCVGRGLEAATVMGQLRSACRALLLQNPQPDHVLAALDHFAAEIPEALCTTVFCGVLEPVGGALVYSSAGHPPGIVAAPDGKTQLLDQGRGMPLAVHPGSPRPIGETVIPRGATLLLYTDGLVERRRQLLTDGIDLAAQILHDEARAALDELPSRIMTRMAPAAGYEDDVALLLYRRTGS